MGENSKISWTTHTFNPWIGCSKVHAGCASCYAEEMMANRYHRVVWGPNGTRSKTNTWRDPVKWNREAQCNCGAAGEGGRECDFCQAGCPRPRVFCASLADVFEDWQGPIMAPGKEPIYLGKDGRASHVKNPRMTMEDLRRDLFALIDETPNLDWLLLTKRPENIGRMWPKTLDVDFEVGSYANICERRSNVWLGTSVSDQATADDWAGRLLEVRDLSPVLFLSVEPLLEMVDLKLGVNRWRCSGCRFVGTEDDETGFGRCGRCGHEIDADDDLNINWVIVGCESSGKKAARFQDSYESAARSIVDQCHEAGIPVFHKQMPLRGNVSHDPEEWPNDLRVREFPKAEPAQ